MILGTRTPSNSIACVLAFCLPENPHRSVTMSLISIAARRVAKRAAPLAWTRIAAVVGDEECCGGGCGGALSGARMFSAAASRPVSAPSAWEEDECCGGGSCDSVVSATVAAWEEDECCGGGSCDSVVSATVAAWEDDECCGGGSCDAKAFALGGDVLFAGQGLLATTVPLFTIVAPGGGDDDCCGGGSCSSPLAAALEPNENEGECCGGNCL